MSADGPRARRQPSSHENRASGSPFSGADAAGAGFLLLGVWLVTAAIGAGIGALVGAFTPLLLAGIFIGLGLGTAVVIRRFRLR